MNRAEQTIEEGMWEGEVAKECRETSDRSGDTSSGWTYRLIRAWGSLASRWAVTETTQPVSKAKEVGRMGAQTQSDAQLAQAWAWAQTWARPWAQPWPPSQHRSSRRTRSWRACTHPMSNRAEPKRHRSHRRSSKVPPVVRNGRKICDLTKIEVSV